MLARILQLIRSGLRKLWRSFKALFIGIWKIITFPFWLFSELHQIFTNASDDQLKLDALKSIISAVGLIATVFAAIGLFVNYQDARQDRVDARLDRQLTQERLITERFTKAVAQLGNSKEEVILGGIYSLERIAKDSPKDQWTIMEVLTAFVRKNSPIPEEIKKLDHRSEEKIKAVAKLKPVNIQVQAALTVIGRRNPEQDNTQEEKGDKILDLSNSNLKGANLESSNLSGANLENSNIENTDLRDANLENVNFENSDLSGADLAKANLENANLKDANLYGAHLIRVNLKDANLKRAILDGTNLESADLSGVELDRTTFSNAYLVRTILSNAKNIRNRQIKSTRCWEKAKFIKDEEANQLKIEEIRKDKASDPKNPPKC